MTDGFRRRRKGVRSSRRRKPSRGVEGIQAGAAACGVIGLVGPAGRAGARARTAPGDVVREWDEATGASGTRGLLADVAAGVGEALD
eukprot:scaffold44964_cov62-Phaeocystis_antarctica.AAC.3